VPLSERIPYADAVPFLINILKWGVGISGWGIGKDSTIFQVGIKTGTEGDTARFSVMICYESIYGGFVSEFVKKGAQFLVIVTNDSWWGSSSGPYQHAQFAVLRAIENRRSIVRCANGGISCFIDAYGRISNPTPMLSRTTLNGAVELRDDSTFYSQHGDLFAVICSYVAGLFILSGLIVKFRK
jgi:apolipoprotein N-acyltransferase